MVLAERELTHPPDGFLRDDDATAHLADAKRYLDKLREQGDGAYSRALAKAVFGIPDEVIDELGWGR